MKKVADYFSSAQLPVMLCVASGESESAGTVTFSKLSDPTTGTNITILSNLEEPKSPLTGEAIDVGDKANVDTASAPVTMDRKKAIASMVCIASCLNCNHDTYTVPELAQEIDAQDIHCTKCGEQITAYYDGDFSASDEEDDELGLEEDDSDDVVDALDEEDADDDDDGDDTELEEEEDEDSYADEEEESEDPVGEVSDDNAEDEDVDDVEIEQDQEDEDEEEDEDVSKVKAKAEKAKKKVETASTEPAPATEAPAAPATTDAPAAPVVETPATPVETPAAPAAPVTTEQPVEAPASEAQASETDANSNVSEEAPATETPAAEAVAEEAPAEPAATTEVPKTTEVVVASVANYEERLQFATLADTSRYEVFLGNTHIGSLIKDEASANVQARFEKQDIVRNAFGSIFWQASEEIAAGDVSKLKDFGFKPATLQVAVDSVVANLVAEKTVELEAEHSTKIDEAVAAVVTSMNVAAAGLNKGLFKGTNFHTELAKILRQYGIQKADSVATRFAAEVTPKFFADVVTAAADLRNESPDYVRGIAKNIETAAFKIDSGSNETDMLVTSALLPVKPESKPAPRAPVVETASARPTSGNPFKRFGINR